MKKIITLLALIIIMLHAVSAISYYFNGAWFVVPAYLSIWLLIVLHLFMLILSIGSLVKGIDDEK